MHRRTRVVACTGLATLCLAVVSVACRDTKVAIQASDRAEQAGAPVSSTRTGPGSRDGRWQGADARSTWHAMLNGPHVVQLDEVALYTDSSRAMRQIQFDSTERLTAVREERVLVVRGQTAIPDTIRTVIAVGWDGERITQQDKQVNGVMRPLQPYELDNIRRHVGELIAQVRAGTPTP